MRNLAPIALFIYNRPEHTLKTLQALTENDLIADSVLYIFCDGPKTDASPEMLQNIAACRRIAHEQSKARAIIIEEQPTNIGLARSILSGVTKVINKHGKIIVVEDDIVTSSGFLRYMNDALDMYEPEEKVMHISAYFYPVPNEHLLPETLFFRVSSCWGWSTWKRSWDKIETDPRLLKRRLQERKNGIADFNIDRTHKFTEQLDLNISGHLHTWAIKWYASIFLNDGLCLHPHRSLVTNIGLDNSGTHDGNPLYHIPSPLSGIRLEKQVVVESETAVALMKMFYKHYRGTFMSRVTRKCRNGFNRLRRLNLQKIREKIAG